MIINVSGTAEEIIAFARTLELGRDVECTGRLIREERDSVNRDRIIDAIKMYRERIGCGLKEAKDFVEASPEGRAYHARKSLRVPFGR